MSTGPDIAGLHAALAALPDRTPEQRRALRVARSAHSAANAIRSGRRYRTRGLPSEAALGRGSARLAQRCELGHFVGSGRACRACTA